MVALEILDNPNCSGTDYQVFQEVGPARPLKKMRLSREGRESWYWVTGYGEDSRICPAYAQRVADSGGGTSFLVYGGAWGIRFKPEDHASEPWDLSSSHQWGEPFKFYGDESDLVYE
ncbi:MAG: hypothetical protein HY714_00940 [Candidatus Omnitrophica bacterium]|nr:hypothetical protein [Candidatus Omnitrophota bacterium]